MQKSVTGSFRTYFGLGALLLALVAGAGPALATHCPADVVVDGVVDVEDIAFVLAEWGLPGSDADINGDGDVGCYDLTYVQGNFGPCLCDGDATGDGSVDVSDQLVVLSTWDNDCRADLDENGIVDGNDIDIVRCQWGTDDPDVDIDGNGEVDTGDLVAVTGAFGTDCKGDLDHSNAVDIGDLLEVLGNWGSCKN